MRKLFAAVIFTCLLAGSYSLAQPVQEPVPQSSEERLNFAGAQWEIIDILIREGDYNKVMPEFDRILELEFDQENFRLVVDSAFYFADELRKSGEHNLAHEMLDATLQHSEQPQDRFILLMLKGKIFKDQGRLQDALSVYRQAQSLREAPVVQ